MSLAGLAGEAFAAWLASLFIYCGVFAVEGLRQGVAVWKAIVGSLLVYVILLVVPSALYLALLTGLSALVGGTALHGPLLFAAIVLGAASLYVGIRMGHMHEEGMMKQFVMFFGAMTLGWGAAGFLPVAGLLAAL